MSRPILIAKASIIGDQAREEIPRPAVGLWTSTEARGPLASASNMRLLIFYTQPNYWVEPP